jgi:hypothetical protein
MGDMRPFPKKNYIFKLPFKLNVTKGGFEVQGFGFLWAIFDLDGQLLDKFPLEVRVAVLRKLVEDKPVP